MKTFDVLVVGGGNAGLSVAGRLRRARMGSIGVIEPRVTHVFAPIQSHIAGGRAGVSEARRRQSRVTPRGVEWIRAAVDSVDAVARTVRLDDGRRLGFGHLVLAPGLRKDWDRVPGLRDAMASSKGISNYSLELAEKAAVVLPQVRGGTVVFTQASQPASCAGSAQKPMYLACDRWRAEGVLADIRVIFVTPESTVGSVPPVDAELRRKLEEYGIETRLSARVMHVDAAEHKIAWEQDGVVEEISYDVLHAAPPQSAATWIRDAGLAADSGLVDIDPRTLQHRRHAHVWALGDAAAIDSEPSGGAIRKQAQALVRNLRAAVRGRGRGGEYDGYTVCPYTVSRRTVVFAEWDREGQLAPSVPGWRGMYRERRLTWILDRRILPWVYWHLILRGRA